jgi:hypothetical protein
MENKHFEDLQAGGKDVFRQFIEQGMGAGAACLMGLEIAALGLENEGGTEANHNAKLGCVRVFLHRLFEGKLINPRDHSELTCKICLLLSDQK